MQRGIWLALVAAVMFALVLAVACRRAPDEERIRAEIETMRSAAEARRPGDVLAYIADDFVGNRGDADRAALSRLLRLELLSRDTVSAGVGPIEIAIDGDRATAKFDLTLRGSSRWLPVGGETYAVVSGWRRDGSRWLCFNASWTETGR